MFSIAERRKFTQKTLAQPTVYLEQLQKRVAVLESLHKQKLTKMRVNKIMEQNLAKQRAKTQIEQKERADELLRIRE